ncbi:MAG TPA: choice-of-anchor L domain-containing protein, partial [Flavobacterium sp.]
MKRITLLILTLFLTISGYSQEFYQDFEGAVNPTSGTWNIGSQNWLVFDNGVGTQNWRTNSATAYPAYQGTVAAFIDRQNIGAGATSIDYLVTPAIGLVANPQLRFFTRTTVAGNQGTIYQIRVAPVATTPDPTNMAAYTLVEEWTEDELTAVYNVWEEKVVPLTNPVGTQVYIAFVKVFTQVGGTLGGDRWLVDDMMVVSECLPPTNLDAACLSTSANLSWDAVGASEWEVIVLPAGATFPPTSGTPITTTDNTSFNVTATTEATPAPLAPLTEYDYYVRAVCTDSESTWTGPVSCTTQAAPPVCGGNFVDAGGTANYPNNSNSTVTICPDPANPTYQVTVTFTAFSVEAGWDGLYVHNGDAINDPLIPSTNGAGNGPGLNVPGAYWGTAIPGPFTSTSADGCLTFHFLSDGIVNNPGWTANVTCNPPPTCPQPTALTATSVTATSAVLAWQNVGTAATSWEIIVLPCADPAPTASSAWIPATSAYTATGLTSATCYKFYVRAICSGTGEVSIISGPINFTTQVAPPVCGGNFVDTGGPTAPYPNNANQIVTICPVDAGDVVTVTFTAFNTEATWDGLYVFNGATTASPQIASTNGPGNVPGGLPGSFWGATIPGPFESSSPDGCLTFWFRSDTSVNNPGWIANVTCDPPPTCPKPTALTTTNVTATSVVVGWTHPGPATAYQVIAVPCGSGTPAASAAWITATGNPFTITGLNSSTCYDYYVRAICSPTDASIPAGPMSFTTQVAPPVCGGTFVDLGGPANYPNNANSIVTICPVDANDIVTVTFTSFSTEANWDGLYVFDGPTTASPQIASTNGPGNVPGGLAGSFWGNAIPGPFESSSPDGCLTFWFRSDGVINNPGWVANVTCDPAPTCPKPTALTTSVVTSNSAILEWTNVGPATAWEVIAVPCNSPIPGPTANWIPTTNNPYTFTGLTPATCYNLYVRAICSATDASVPSSPVTITTQVAPPVCGGNYVDAGGLTAPYPNSSNSIVTICPDVIGEQVTVTFTSFNTEAFWDGLYVHNGNSTAAPLFASENPGGNVPGGVPGAYWGNVIPEPFTSSSPDGCLTFHFLSDGSVNNPGWVANVTCDPPPTCPKPTAVTVLTTTGTSATIGWTESGSANTWQVLVLPATDPAPTATSTGWIQTTDNPYVYTGLTYGVQYKVYVRAVCAADDISLWSSPASFASYLPPIATSTGEYTNVQLIEDILLNSTCASVTNITSSTGTNFASTNGIGYFHQNGSAFPFEEGIVLSTGSANSAPGPNDTTLGEGAFNWPGDPQLEAVILAGTGTPMNSFNATVLEFDFIPVTDEISFNFIFASEEYGTFQCTYSDSFAFLLTNVATGVTTNLAVLPSSTIPISVVTIRDAQYNPGCASANPQYFDEYYLEPDGENPLAAPINFNGVTVPLTATSVVVPQQQYHIKLVIADRGDSAFDSAVFLEGGSFDIGNIELGDDFTQADGTALCYGSSYILNTGLDPDEYDFSWTVDGVTVPNETGATITVTEPGVYGVTAVYTTSTCSATDAVTIEFYPALTTGTPNDLTACNSLGYAPFTLTQNNAVVLGSLSATAHTVTYYATNADALAEINALVSPYTNVVQFLQTVFVRVENNTTGCFTVTEFDLIVQDLNPLVTITPDFSLCAGTAGTIVVTPTNFDPADATYSWTLDGVPLNDTTGTITVTQGGIYVVTVNVSGCTVTATTTVTMGNIVADEIQDATVCDSFTLPTLSPNNTYYTATGGPGGTGTAITDAVITQSQTVYVWAQSGTCSNESNFIVTVNQTPVFTLTPNFTICSGATGTISVTPGNFNAGDVTYSWTLDGVPYSGTTGTISVTQAGIYEVTVNNNGCTASASTVISVGSITADVLPDVTVCDSFTLPALSPNNTYYTATGGPGGTGSVITGGAVTQSQTIYIWAESGTCSDESNFVVTVNQTPVFTVTPDFMICSGAAGTISVTPGNFNPSNVTYSWTFNTAPYAGSTGTISVTQAGTYEVTVSNNGCTASASTVITVGSITADVLPDVTVCDSFTLPVLSLNNTYYTATGGPGGTGSVITAGAITQSQTVYIWAQSGTCTDESNFIVTVNQTPVLPVIQNVTACDSYTLPSLATGSYYSASGGPNGGGTPLTTVTGAGPHTVYVYAQTGTVPNCSSETSF